MKRQHPICFNCGKRHSRGVPCSYYKAKTEEQPPDESAEALELDAIRYFAATGKGGEQAIQVYERHVGESGPEIGFMSEVLSPCPDLHLRAVLRRMLVRTWSKDGH